MSALATRGSLGTVRADVVGSLLRPPALQAARLARARGELAADGLAQAEDRAVDEAVALQEEAGLDAVTDGEYRRDNFYSLVFDAVEGFEPLSPADSADIELSWRGGTGRAQAPSRAVCTGRLRRRRPLAADAFAYLKGRVRRAVPKVTLPAPSFLARYWSPRLSAHAYATRDAYLADVVAVLRQEVADLVAAGARYIQFDAPNYALLVDPDSRARFGDPERLVPAWAEADNAVLQGFSDVTFGLHMCRGNNAGMWAAAGGYEPVAEAFGRLRHERLLLEYDDERSGTFAPLAHVPDDKVVVLGLVSTKAPEVEDPSRVEARVREATAYVPLERLAVSPQCGFASVAAGNPVAWEAQAAKLAVVGEVAKRLWP